MNPKVRKLLLEVITDLKVERDMYKANHADMVKRNKELRDRPDLGDRVASVDALYKRIAELEEQVESYDAAEYDRQQDGGYI